MNECIVDVPLWMAYALAEIGVAEVAGKKDHPRIREYHRATQGRQQTPDEIPWCSSFVNWCMDQVGIEGTQSKRARSWLDWGGVLEQPLIGCVAVLWRGTPQSPKGHVGFFCSEQAGRVYLLGGNQGNQVSVRGYPAGRVLSYRWPEGEPRW